jgi:hypothetical protein
VIGRLEFRHLHPSQERSGSYAGNPRSFLHVPLGEQRGDGFLLLTAEFLSMSCHQVPPDANCGLFIAIPSPSTIPAELPCLLFRTE